jgi:LPLT family lysophospholipid transporter-like MFS transporter
LVRANGYIEGSTVCAALLGTVLGGALVSPQLRNLLPPELAVAVGATPTSLHAGMLGLLLLYLLAALLNAGVPDSGVRYARHSFHAVYLVRRFFRENLTLWRDPLGGVSMAVTTLLWGIGATLQLVVLRWAESALGLALSQAAYLQGVTAVGVIAGATLASQMLRLEQATRVLPLGIAMGLLVPCMVGVHSLGWAAGLLMLVGGLAGFFVVPMNALLQHRGQQLLTAGRSIAVQGFNENAGILLMLSLYAAATALRLELHQLLWCFGLLVASTMALITLRHHRAGAANAAVS